jgi:hypothetical protein
MIEETARHAGHVDIVRELIDGSTGIPRHERAAGTVVGYAAGVLGLLYAALSLYWTVGGTVLIDTVGGTIEELALRGGAAAVALGLGATVLKLVASTLAFALVRSRGQARWLLILSALAGFVLIVYGGVLVAVGALVDRARRSTGGR